MFNSARYTKDATELALILQNLPLANRLHGLTMESHIYLCIGKGQIPLEILDLNQKIAELGQEMTSH